MNSSFHLNLLSFENLGLKEKFLYPLFSQILLSPSHRSYPIQSDLLGKET
jgi:hypothetical protein